MESATEGGEGWRILCPLPSRDTVGWTRVTLYPHDFNVVVDAVIRHWVTVTVPMEAGEEGLGERVQILAVFSMWMKG